MVAVCKNMQKTVSVIEVHFNIELVQTKEAMQKLSTLF